MDAWNFYFFPFKFHIKNSFSATAVLFFVCFLFWIFEVCFFSFFYIYPFIHYREMLLCNSVNSSPQSKANISHRRDKLIIALVVWLQISHDWAKSIVKDIPTITNLIFCISMYSKRWPCVRSFDSYSTAQRFPVLPIGRIWTQDSRLVK